MVVGVASRLPGDGLLSAAYAVTGLLEERYQLIEAMNAPRAE
jgi:hypothetical protein